MGSGDRWAPKTPSVGRRCSDTPTATASCPTEGDRAAYDAELPHLCELRSTRRILSIETHIEQDPPIPSQYFDGDW